MKLRLIFTENEWGLLSIGNGAPCDKKEALCELSLHYRGLASAARRGQSPLVNIIKTIRHYVKKILDTDFQENIVGDAENSL